VLDGLPENMRRFLDGRVESLEQLEVLLYLARVVEPCAPAEVMAALGVRDATLARALRALVDQGLVVREQDRYLYRPKTAALQANVADLTALYAARRIDVVNAISAKAIARVQAIADAFNLRKDKGK
jgi:DNA-binding MarR family transcriptional regulator